MTVSCYYKFVNFFCLVFSITLRLFQFSIEAVVKLLDATVTITILYPKITTFVVTIGITLL